MVGVLVGALAFWLGSFVLAEDEPAENLNAVATTSTSVAPDPTVPAPDPATTLDENGGAEEAAARAADRAAQSNLRNAFTAARTISTDYEGRFEKNAAGDPIDGEALQAENPDPNFTYGPSGSAAEDVVSVRVESVDGPNSHIWLITQSSAGGFHCIGGTTDGEVSRTKGESEAAAQATCNGGANEW